MSILERLGLVAATVPPPAPEIERRLSSLAPSRARYIAAFAGLLARVAYADGEISDAELARIESLVATHAGLGPEDARIVGAVAKTAILRDTEKHLLTRHFNEVANESEKLALIECLYAVASADDVVAFVEDNEVRQIASALLLPWSEVLKIRSRYRDKLEELRKLAEARGDEH
jgi:uncharacterized tellurite resistance protein B-like protein